MRRIARACCILLSVNTHTHTRDSEKMFFFFFRCRATVRFGVTPKTDIDFGTDPQYLKKKREKQNGKIVEMIWLCLLFTCVSFDASYQFVIVISFFLFLSFLYKAPFYLFGKCILRDSKKNYRSTKDAHVSFFFSFGSWWDVISCRHRHAYKPWWQLPAISFFLLSLLVFYFVPANITWTFHRQNLSRFSSLVQTPGLVSCLFNVYIHTVRV